MTASFEGKIVNALVLSIEAAKVGKAAEFGIDINTPDGMTTLKVVTISDHVYERLVKPFLIQSKLDIISLKR